MAAEATRAIKIFYCYARKDRALRDELGKHLKPLKFQGKIAEWYDRDIQPGADWAQEIDSRLNTTDIFLLLVSPDFVNSDYCWGIEMQRALERHRVGEARVIPIILRPVPWEETPLRELQVLPTGGKPVTTWRNRDTAFMSVARDISNIVGTLPAQEKRRGFPKRTQSIAVGVDLGGTNSVVAVMNPTDTNIVVHKDPISNLVTTPSCIWKNPKNGEILIGRRAFARIGTIPRPIKEIKRLMGTSTKLLLTDEEVTPERVSAYILAEMKRQIEEDVARFDTDSTEWIVDRATITVPAYFNQARLEATRQAGEIAGFQALDLLPEPIAAVRYHCWRTGMRDGIFMVYDFGGSTFDVSVVLSTAGTFKILAFAGNNRLGGNDIDAVLAEDLLERLLYEGYALRLDLKNDLEDQLRFDMLKWLAEGVKKALSNANEFYLRESQSISDKKGERVVIEIMYERHEVEALMRPIVERTLPHCNEALEAAERMASVTLADVDAIILVGGSTHIPLVREMIRETFCADSVVQEPRAKCAEPVYDSVGAIVASGAAIYAAGR
jgi:molecular chaperone DnaK